MTKTRLMPSNHWDWSMPVPFSQGWKTDGLIFVGGQISADAKGRTVGAGDIATQTRNVFEFIKRVLEEAGGDLSDIVKLNTYYQFEGEGDAITQFWEEMTAVRLEYLADPGPVGNTSPEGGASVSSIRLSGKISPELLCGNHSKRLTASR